MAINLEIMKDNLKKAKKRRASRKQAINERQMRLLDLINSSQSKEKKEEIAQTIKVMLELKNNDTNQWRGLLATPPHSYLEKILECFNSKTDIPLEIPFFTGLSCLSAHLLKEGCYINFDNKKVKPDLWTVVLAQSGAGKTYATNSIMDILGIEKTFSETASSARFIEELELNNNGFWIRDEFLQFLKNIELQPHMKEMKDYLLRLYDGHTIQRTTKKENIVIEDPALVIFCTTVLETFIKNVEPESLVDGFAQRFNYVIAKQDPKREMKDFPLYKISSHKEDIKNAWDNTIKNIKHKEYIFSENAEKGFITSFSLLSKIKMPNSFYRRIMFRGIKYALLYHIITGKENNIIDEVDMGWAGRLCVMHLKDAAELLDGYEQTDLQKLLIQASDAVERLKEKGKPITPRNLILSTNRIRTASEARALLEIIKGDE